MEISHDDSGGPLRFTLTVPRHWRAEKGRGPGSVPAHQDPRMAKVVRRRTFGERNPIDASVFDDVVYAGDKVLDLVAQFLSP